MPAMLRFVAITSILLLCSPVFAQEQTETAPESPADTLIGEGRLHLATGAAGLAEQAFRQAIAADPQSAVAHNELGVALFHQGATEAAIDPLKRAVELDPSLAHAWANLAEAQRLGKQFRWAAVSYHKFLQLKARDPYAIYGLALCFEGYEDFDKALRTLTVAERHADADDQLMARINTAKRRVQRRKAEATDSFLVRGDRHFIARHWDIALQLYQRGQAAELADEAQKTQRDGILEGRIGLIRAIQGELAAAQTSLEKALQAVPTDPVALAAYKLLLDALEIPPESPADNVTGDGMLQVDRAALAHRLLSQALVSAPTKDHLIARGEAALRMGQLDSAMDDFTQATDDPRGAAGRAEVLLIREQPEDAAAELQQVPNAPAPAHLSVWRRSLMR